MKILVTGANGYIGSKVVKYLLDYTNNKVIATDFLDNHIDKRADIVLTDIFDLENPFEYFKEPDICIHLAWRDGFIHNSPNHILDLPKHYMFIRKLLENGLKQISIMGTMHEIGYWEGSIDENTPTNPQSLYGISKNALRNAVGLLASEFQSRFLWLRAYYIYSNDEYGQSIFSKIVRAAKEGKTTFPFTSGKNKYDFIHVDELARQISLASVQSDVLGIVNVCSGTPISLADKVEFFIKSLDLNIRLEYGAFPDRKYDSPIVYGNNEKIRLIMKND